MAVSEAHKRASMKYDKENMRQIKFNLSLKYDQDVIAMLDSVPNKQGYIKELIRADIAARANSKKEEPTMKETVSISQAATVRYQVEYTDPDTGATSPIDTINARAGYTADDYIRDCDENADSNWCEMLHRGTVTLQELD